MLHEAGALKSGPVPLGRQYPADNETQNTQMA
jgi:hypothetical protein